VQQERLVFKADVMANTPDVIYVEGVYVAPEHRGKGVGLECFSRLTSYLLRDRESLCLLVNEQNLGAHAFYRRAGYELCSYYDTIFLEQALKPTVMAVN
jgi:predicted GNAT family acetyltransferase